MRWEELSLEERSQLMNLYLKGGILSLRQMKDHYNRFDDGGEVDNVHSTPEQAWMVNWINNRQDVLKENIRDTKDFPALYSDKRLSREAFEEAQKQSRRVLSVKQYNYGNGPQFQTVPEDLYERAKFDILTSKGTYVPLEHSIVYNRYNNPGRTTQTHELTHAMGAGPQLDAILWHEKGPSNHLREGIKRSPYLDSYKEVYPRLMELRRALNLDPKKRDYTTKDLEEMRNKVGNTNLLDRYTDDYLLYLFNNVASTKSSVETDGRKLAAYGGPLRDDYDNPDQYYDYITAEEAGDMYDPKTKHWSSRDPRTGMILKNPKHPTFNMAIREDQSSGYIPFIDSSTGRYYTLRPEEYATAPNKVTLRRANFFQTGGLKDKISYQTPEMQRKVAAKNNNYWGSLPIEDKSKLLQYYGNMGVSKLDEVIDYYNSSPREIREHALKDANTLRDDLVIAPHYEELYGLKNGVDTTALKYSMRAFRLADIPDRVNAAYHGNTVEESGGNFYREQANDGPGYGRDQRERWTTKGVVKNGKKVKVKEPNERWTTYIDNTPDDYTNDDRETLWSIGALKNYIPGGRYKQEWNRGASSYKDTKTAQKDATSGNLPIDENTILLRQIFFRPAGGKSDSTRVAAGKILKSILSENQRDTTKITKMP